MCKVGSNCTDLKKQLRQRATALLRAVDEILLQLDWLRRDILSIDGFDAFDTTMSVAKKT